jgi:hypothetical protein
MKKSFCAAALFASASAFGEKDVTKPAALTGFGLYGECGAGKKAEPGEMVDYGIDVRCKNLRYSSPSSWFPTEQKAEYDLDLAIIGGGIQAGYLVSELTKKLGAENMRKLKIGMFDESDRYGGRVMSAWGPGSLGNGVSGGLKTQPMEYGAMRVDPKNHYLVWDAIEEVVKRKDPKAVCKRTGYKSTPVVGDDVLKELLGDSIDDLGQDGDCPSYMTFQHTSNMRYHTTASDAGEYLKSASVYGDGSVENACLSLAGKTYDYIIKNWSTEKQEQTKTSEAVDLVCAKDTCDKVEAGFCDLCAKFPSPGTNMVSCIGYDDIPSVASNIGLLEAMAVTGRGVYNCLDEIDGKKVSTESCSKLYFWLEGVERFAMDLLYADGTQPVGPAFKKKLTKVDFTGAADAAAKQAKTVYNSKGNILGETPTNDEPVSLSFADESFMKAKNVYLTVLPHDLVQIEGFEAWEPPVDVGMLPFGATKLFLHWQDGLPESIVKATDSGKIRLVLDGNRPGQTARQVFYWDPNTVLVYGTAPKDLPDLPVNVQEQIMVTEGMTPMIDSVMKSFNAAFDGDVEYPTWARVKAWESGSLGYYQSGCGDVKCESPLSFSSRFARPMGQENPVFYGNSFMNGNGGNGWIQGSFEEVQLHLPALVERLEAALEAKA